MDIPERNGSGEGRARPEGLRRFVEEFQSKQHQSIETRVMLLCSFAVFAQFMFTNPAEGQDVTYSTLTFASLCVLVTVFSTWLDYFPSRLSDVELRPAYGQGLALACLLLPSVATACLHQVLLHQPSVAGWLYLYCNVLTQLSVAVVMATLLHTLPYPNSIVLYNFSLAGLSYFFQWWMGTPVFLSLPALVLFSILVPLLLSLLPKSFTLAEVIVLSQGLVITLLDVTLLVLHLYNLYNVPITYTRSTALLYVELLVTGVFVCCVALSPVLYKVSSARDSTSLKFWSGTFILLSLSVGFLLILPWLGSFLNNHHPIPFVFYYLSTTHTRLFLVGYWILVTIVTGVLVAAQSSTGGWLAPLKSSQPSSLWMRKCFHVSALCAYVPGLLLDVDFLSFAASMATFLFIVAELMRVTGMWPWGEGLTLTLQPLCDQRDDGPLIVTHLYLLLGFSLPLWLSPVIHGVGKLSLYSGVISLGVGDSMAAVAGSLFGKLQWPGTSKTLEGSVMSLLSQLLSVALFVLLDSEVPSPTVTQWMFISGGIALTTLLEAYTWQIDNLVLSLTLCALYLAFL